LLDRLPVGSIVYDEEAVFWVVAPCNLIEVYQVSEVLAASIIRTHIALMMEASRTFETLVNFYQTTQHCNPEDSHLCTHCRVRTSNPT
jgi:hypothetical protein